MTKNEQTVTEIYVVDETIEVDESRPSISPAVKKALEIGSLCNNASNSTDGEGKYVGQSTDVALLNVLSSFGLPDQRHVSLLFITSLISCTDSVSLVIHSPFGETFQLRTKIYGRQRHSFLFYDYLFRYPS